MKGQADRGGRARRQSYRQLKNVPTQLPRRLPRNAESLIVMSSNSEKRRAGSDSHAVRGSVGIVRRLFVAVRTSNGKALSLNALEYSKRFVIPLQSLRTTANEQGGTGSTLFRFTS